MTLSDERKDEVFGAVAALDEHLGVVLGCEDYSVGAAHFGLTAAAAEYITIDVSVEDILGLMEKGIL